MKRPARFLLAASLVFATGATAAETRVVAQDLASVKASGVVSAASWTRRQDSYTLQLVLPRSALSPAFGARTLELTDGRRLADASGAPSEVIPGQRVASAARFPRIQVWLLRADGTQVLPVWRSADPGASNKCGARCLADEVLYRFPVAESMQAVAAAIQIGDAYYIEKLQPLAAN